MSSTQTFLWSIERYEQLIDKGILDGEDVELINGEILVMSPEGVEHFCTNDYLDEYLRDLLVDRAKISKTPPLVLDNSQPEPDIAVLKLPKSTYRTRKPIATDVYWLIEVANTTLSKDLNEKATIYARNNIPEYWVVNLKDKQLVVHTEPTNSVYQVRVELKDGEVNPIAFPDLSIPVSNLFV